MRTTIKRLWLLAITLCFTLGASAYDAKIDGIYYNFDTGTNKATVTYLYYVSSSNSSAYSGNITIPKSVTYNGTTYSVTTIGSCAFYCCRGLTSVTILNSVTTIDDGAFYYCSGLTSVTIGNSVTTIGDWAFWGCSGLTSVTIPNSVTTIGSSAFSGCSGLENIIVEAGNTTYDSRNNSNAIIKTASNTLIAGCKNTIIPNSVTSIGMSAFERCYGLSSVTIPNSVTTIGSSAFLGCSGLTSIEIPYSVKSIGEGAFDGCSGLTSVVIPNSVTSIGDWAFYECTGLTSVTIPNSVTTIGSSAFDNCTGLTSVTIPNSVTTIGNYAFSNCSPDTVYVRRATPLSISSYVFNKRADIILCVPPGAKSAYEAADYWKDFKEIVEYDLICATPVLTYQNGKIHCTCETEGVEYFYSISPVDRTGRSTSGIIELGTTYTIRVRATRDGYSDSEEASIVVDMEHAGDMNGDGIINVADITGVVNAALGRE